MSKLDPVSKIESLRKSANLTQLQLSQAVGVTETTIANWERGRRGLDWIDRLIKLCKALDCQIEDLIEYPEETRSEELEGMIQIFDISGSTLERKLPKS